MITIKRNREWIKIDSWQDVMTLPGYVAEINPKTVELDSVIGKYREPEYRICGLSNCHTKHYRGYLITTKKGDVANIGVNCGATHFGVDFETMSRQFDRDYQNQERRELILSAKNKLTTWQSKVDDLVNAPRGASWLLRQYTLSDQRETGFPYCVTVALMKMSKNNSNVLTKERRATKEEVAIMNETGQRTDFVVDAVGVIDGIGGFFNIEKLKAIFANDLRPGFKELRDFDVEQASEGSLMHWSKWCGEVESKINESIKIIEEASLFFDQENLIILIEIAESDEDEKRIMTVAKRY